jgi:fructokinase
MILCAGEALIDMLPRKTEGGEAAFAPYPGGAVFNTAIALARLDVAGQLLQRAQRRPVRRPAGRVLTANGVDQSLIARVATGPRRWPS